MGTIYFASSQPYEQQDLRPVLRDMDLAWVKTYFSWVSFTYSSTVISIDNRGLAGFVEFFIRKGAHVIVFFVLGLLTYRMLILWKMRKWYRVMIAFSFVLAYAAIDEYRHLLNPERTGLIEDVILDTIGGSLGILFALFVHKVFQKWRTRENQ